MKIATIVAIGALVCALGAAGLIGYGFVETKPNCDATEDEIDQPAGNKSERLIQAERASYDDYHKALSMEVMGAWAGGFLALVLGAIAAKKGAKGMGIAAIVIGLAAAGVAVAIMPSPL